MAVAYSLMRVTRSEVRVSSKLLAVISCTVITFAALLLRAQDASLYRRSSSGTKILENDAGTIIKVLVDASALGDSSIEIAEATLPVGAGAGAAPHRHGSTEMIYVVSGELDHVVNGTAHRLQPGMVGIVKPADTVIHRVIGQTPVKMLLIWAPGGEVNRLAERFRVRAIR
jgi:quercetin dioxygenase-like cupin family protein